MNRTLIKKLAAAVVVASGLAAMGAHVAGADPMYWTSNGGFAADATVGCNTATHRVTVMPSVGNEPGYYSGQYVSYQVAERDVTYSTGGRWSWFAVQGPFFENSYLARNGFYINQPQTLPSFTFTGVAGHRYQVGVFVQWWNPASRTWEGNVSVAVTSYGQTWYSGGVSYYSNTATCWT